MMSTKIRSFSLLAGILAIASVGAAQLAGSSTANLRILGSLPLFEGHEELVSGESRITRTLVEIFSKIQDESRSASSIHRGTHARGTCFAGETRVLSQAEQLALGYSPSEIAAIRKGFFSQARTAQTGVRFANAKGQVLDDKVPDVRGVSFSIDTTGISRSASGAQRLDFMMNTTPMFAVSNITEFHQLMRAARLAQGDPYVVNPLYFGVIYRARNLLQTYERSDILSYATEEYWANLPYSHGVTASGSADQIVKYKLTPCDGRGIQPASSEGKANDYLQVDIDQRAQRGEVCFLIQAQVFNKNKLAEAGLPSDRTDTEWIENGGEHWPETALPFYSIAELRIPPGTTADGKSSQQISCDQLSFNTRLQSTRAHQPLGSLARVRAWVEEVSRARRTGEMP